MKETDVKDKKMSNDNTGHVLTGVFLVAYLIWIYILYVFITDFVLML